MAKYFTAFAIVFVTASVTKCAQLPKFTDSKAFKQGVENDEENDRGVDQNARRVQGQWILNADRTMEEPDLRKTMEAMSAMAAVNKNLNQLDGLMRQGLPEKGKGKQEAVRISLLPSQMQKPDQHMHIYNPNIFYPGVIDNLENNTSSYSELPKRKRKPVSTEKSLRGNALPNAFQLFGSAQDGGLHFGKGVSDRWTPVAKTKRIVKRMAQQMTKAKKEQKLKKAKDKRRRKQRRILRHNRRLGRAPKKKGDGGKNKVKKVYKRYRKGNSTHSFRTTTERIVVKSKRVDGSVIPRWVPDGSETNENVTSEQLGKNDVSQYDASTVESGDEPRRDYESEDESEDKDKKKSEDERDDEDEEDNYDDEEDGSDDKDAEKKKSGKESGKKKSEKKKTVKRTE